MGKVTTWVHTFLCSEHMHHTDILGQMSLFDSQTLKNPYRSNTSLNIEEHVSVMALHLTFCSEIYYM